MNEITMQLVADKYIKMALEEDINSEDISTNAVMPEYKKGEVTLLAKQDGIIAGLQVFKRVFTILDPNTEVIFAEKDGNQIKDGDAVTNGQVLATVVGDIRVLLSGERTALNYLQRMSGIATYTNNVAALLKGTNTKLLDTRKTTPCMRIFEKYAVRAGGGNNHRYNLSDAVMLKDNHIDAAGGVARAIQMAREYASFVCKIEVETENLDMVREAVEAGADIIMLDNMSPELMAEAIKIIDGRAKTECSGNITKENIETITKLGVDYVSSGALTHSAPILDISLKHLHPVDKLCYHNLFQSRRKCRWSRQFYPEMNAERSCLRCCCAPMNHYRVEKSEKSIMSAVRLSYRISHCSVQKGIRSYQLRVVMCTRKLQAARIASGL